ncbi:lipoate--protein ligase family protein [Brevibacillus humidisoli]|uniref:lipoate--protein ligase family protein n=1 Tax=Brevibacillus humidisoli TaxID=2895522 RepID=UPI001E60CBC5|nr:lipoate--protein ligase family protein [Brevibacillus humidisoli]UFJ42225.1 lipoate--protein ligase family protein [Brevibacillus humidisoli]
MPEPRLFHWIDSGTHTSQPIEPLAFDEAIANGMDRPEAVPIIHCWIYDRGLFLGRRDAKLPRLPEALRHIAQSGYGVVLRSSGGACVPLDSGVLNIAFHLPNTGVPLDTFFQFAAEAMQLGLQHYGRIVVGPVIGSYCVGDYDFSIDGKKIGGMAQRRTRQGAILQLCINVEGSGRERGERMEFFYQEAGLAEMEQKSRPVPSIYASTIGSLSEAAGRLVSVDEVKQVIYDAFSAHWQCERIPFSLPLAAVVKARDHLQNRLGLFSYTADELLRTDWQLPK